MERLTYMRKGSVGLGTVRLRKAMASFLLLACFALSSRAADLNADLLAAASKGDADAVKALLAEGADVNAKNSYGATAPPSRLTRDIWKSSNCCSKTRRM